MRVRLLLNIGWRDAARLRLDPDEALDGRTLDVAPAAADELLSRGWGVLADVEGAVGLARHRGQLAGAEGPDNGWGEPIDCLQAELLRALDMATTYPRFMERVGDGQVPGVRLLERVGRRWRVQVQDPSQRQRLREAVERRNRG